MWKCIERRTFCSWESLCSLVEVVVPKVVIFVDSEEVIRGHLERSLPLEQLHQNRCPRCGELFWLSEPMVEHYMRAESGSAQVLTELVFCCCEKDYRARGGKFTDD